MELYALREDGFSDTFPGVEDDGGGGAGYLCDEVLFLKTGDWVLCRFNTRRCRKEVVFLHPQCP